MPFKPADTKTKDAFERSTVFEDVITKIDDACLMRIINEDGAIMCVYRVDNLPEAMITALIKIYDEYGWVLTAHAEEGMRANQDPTGFYLTEKEPA